jgi:spermidine synthase
VSSATQRVARGYQDAASLGPWTELGRTEIPGAPGLMRLMQRGQELSIAVGPAELMTNQFRSSERALGTLTCARLQDRPAPRVLIGGLGMGFTLRGALDALGPDASVIVAELVPAVAEWARGPLSSLFEGCLDDPRLEIRVEDVHRTIQSGPAQFDAILLDVDNGAHGLTRPANDRLYDVHGLRRARFALRPKGILAVWSGGPDRKFKARLKLAGFDVTEERVYANGISGRRHVLWLATRPEAPADQDGTTAAS